MSSLLGGGVCVLWRGVVCVCPACPGGGGEGEGVCGTSNPGHLPWVTRYSMSMLSSHDQGR